MEFLGFQVVSCMISLSCTGASLTRQANFCQMIFGVTFLNLCHVHIAGHDIAQPFRLKNSNFGRKAEKTDCSPPQHFHRVIQAVKREHQT